MQGKAFAGRTMVERSVTGAVPKGSVGPAMADDG